LLTRKRINADIIDMAEKYESGMTTTEIGKLYDLAPPTVCDYLRSHGVDLRNNRESFIRRAKRMMADYEELGTYQKVADKYGISRQRVYGIIKKYKDIMEGGGNDVKPKKY